MVYSIDARVNKVARGASVAELRRRNQQEHALGTFTLRSILVLAGGLQRLHREERQGAFSFSASTTLCRSSLVSAGYPNSKELDQSTRRAHTRASSLGNDGLD